MHSLLGEARDHGVMLALASRVLRGTLVDDNIVLDIASEGSEPMTVSATTVINAAGSQHPLWPAA